MLSLLASSTINPSFFLIGGIVMAVICGFVAQSKGRSVVMWVVLGFVFGLIALIILAFLKKQEPSMPMNTMSSPPPPPPMSPPPPPPAPPTG
jgi:4-hydroxybenzoate polyprenyltransferase